MTTATAPSDVEKLNAAIADLIGAEDTGFMNTELTAAANFALRYGPLGELFAGVELHRAQAARRVPAAWGLLAHWSIVRRDPDPPAGATIEQLCPGCGVCADLEVVNAYRARFETQVCGDCGGGAGAHGVVIGSPGHPGVVCRGRWQRVEPLVALAEDVAGDQIGEGCSARWVAPLAGGVWAVVTRSYYLAHKDDGRVLLERDDHYQVSRDPDVPSESELAAYAHSSDLYSGDPHAEDLQALAAESFAPDDGEWQNCRPSAYPFANAGWPGDT